jgi:hypothetical protein
MFTPGFCGVHVARSLVFCVVPCRSFVVFYCPLSFGHRVVCRSSIYGLSLPPFGIFNMFLPVYRIE